MTLPKSVAPLFAAFACFALLAAVGCESKPETEAKAKTTPTAEESATKTAVTPSSSACAKGGGEPELISADAEAILAAVRAPGAKAVLVNAWATWCPPCVEEFPHFVELYRDHCDEGLRVLFVSADFSKQRDDAVAFLEKQGVDFPSFIKKGDEELFINTFNPEWSGALPATFVYDGEGKQLHFLEESLDKAQLEALVAPLLANPDNTKDKP